MASVASVYSLHVHVAFLAARCMTAAVSERTYYELTGGRVIYATVSQSVLQAL